MKFDTCNVSVQGKGWVMFPLKLENLGLMISIPLIDDNNVTYCIGKATTDFTARLSLIYYGSSLDKLQIGKSVTASLDFMSFDKVSPPLHPKGTTYVVSDPYTYTFEKGQYYAIFAIGYSNSLKTTLQSDVLMQFL